MAAAAFRQTQDPLQAALLYLAAGKRNTLSNLAKAARDEKKSLAKLLQFDMTTERGRQVVEKNAYHLLRKREYMGAAALFLLPQPPNLSVALDVLVRHVYDPLLALLVSRLVEANMHPHVWGPEGGGEGGREERVPVGVGPVTRELLEKDVIPWAREESEGGGLEAAAWLWLGKGEEAVAALERGAEDHRGDLRWALALSTEEVGEEEEGGQRSSLVTCSPLSPFLRFLPYESALYALNTCMSKVLAPALASHLDPSFSLAWRTSALRVSEFSQTPGMDLVALAALDEMKRQAPKEGEEGGGLGAGTALMVVAGKEKDIPRRRKSLFPAYVMPEEEKEDEVEEGMNAGKKVKMSLSDESPRSSIRPYRPPPRTSSSHPSSSATAALPPPPPVPSGLDIFAAFDAPPPPPPPGSNDIFAAFDTPSLPPSLPSSLPPSADSGASSIFDAYDMPSSVAATTEWYVEG